MNKIWKFRLLLVALFTTLSVVVCGAQTIGFSLKMSHTSYVIGEQVFATVKIVNKGVQPIVIDDYAGFRENRLFFEVSLQQHVYLKQTRPEKIIADLDLSNNESSGFDINISEWYNLLKDGHYTIRAVLICNGLRYETQNVTFDVVPGIELARTTQFVITDQPIERILSLVYWARENREFAFLKAFDTTTGVIHNTLVLGDILRVKKPSIVAINDRSFHIYRQATRDVLIRSLIVSDAEGVSLQKQEQAIDSVSSPMVDSLREAVRNTSGKKKAK